MARILKYQLESLSKQKVKTCVGLVLTIQFQYGIPTMWVLVEDETKTVERVVHMIGTGIAFNPNGSQYLTTMFLDGGGFVLHVFIEDISTRDGEALAEN